MDKVIWFQVFLSNTVNYMVLSNYFYSIVKLATLVEGDGKIPFSIATTLRCKEGRYSIPWIAPPYACYVSYIAEC